MYRTTGGGGGRDDREFQAAFINLQLRFLIVQIVSLAKVKFSDLVIFLTEIFNVSKLKSEP